MEISKYSFGDKSPIVVFGSSPTALEELLDNIEKNDHKPSLIIGMPVGFIGVEQSKKRLIKSNQNYIVLGSTRGGAAMAGATINALLRSSIQMSIWIKQPLSANFLNQFVYENYY